MPDVIDVAQEYEERHRDASLAKLRAELHQANAIPAARDCRSCGDPIPAERLAVQPNAQQCTDCLQQHERNHGR